MINVIKELEGDMNKCQKEDHKNINFTQYNDEKVSKHGNRI